MINTETMSAAEFNDADLVAESLRGNREAFRRIVERYQTLISSLGYCATGNVSLSEDLAQETFVTAWKRLADLREPAKLRAWLCGIHRFLVSKEFRRLGREPVHAAEPLEAVDEWSSPEPLPPDRAISDEEKAILWRSIERIPEIYREPLVLYYREQQSIAAVAQCLELSEDTVKQRLTRGRRLLHRQVLAFVAAALDRTKPDKAFTLGVLAALPLVVTTTKAAAAGVVLKGGSTVKATTSLAMLGAALTASVLWLFSVLGFFAFTGACVGYMMGRACQRSARDLEQAIACWRTLAIGFLAVVAPAFAANWLISNPAWCHTYFPIATGWLRLIYPVVLVALLIWLGRWWHGLRHAEGAERAPEPSLKRRFAVWLALGMLVPGLFCADFIYVALSPSWWTTQSQYLSAAQAQQVFASRKDAEVRLEEYSRGTRELWIKLPENRGRVAFFTTPDDATMVALNQSGIAYQTQVEGRDFVEGGVTWHGVLFLSIFVMSMGGLTLASRPWQRTAFVWRKAEVQRDERAAQNAFKAMAVSVALVMLTVGVLLGLMTRWGVRRVGAAAVPGIVATEKWGEYEVFQFSNGKSELWICQRAHVGHPDFIAPADPATLAFLTEKGIAYKTFVQGRDFGYDFMPRPWWSLPVAGLLVGGALTLLWRVSPRFAGVLVALAMLGLSVLIGLMPLWHASRISAETGRAMIVAHPTDGFMVYEYDDASRELWVIAHGRRHCYIAPADDSTLALLAEKKIPFKTLVQGRDFGYGQVPRGVATLLIAGCMAVAALVLWLAWRKKTEPATA